MAKQLEILVTARDNASNTFKQVGDSAGGLSGKLGALDTVVGAGKGIKSAIRNAKAIALAYEVIPVGIDAAKAAFATLSGTAEEAAAGQRQLLTSISEFPIIGKLAAGAVEFLGGKLAHAFGKRSTAEAEADVAAQKKILTDYAAEVPKIAQQLAKANNEVSLLGLTPSEASIEKAKQKYKEAAEAIGTQKQTIWRALNAQTGDEDRDLRIWQMKLKEATNDTDKNEAVKHIEDLQSRTTDVLMAKMGDLNKIESDAAKVRDDEIQQSNSKRIAEEREFSLHLRDIVVSREHELTSLNDSLQATLLEGDNRGYEARLVNAKAQLDRQVEAIKDAADKQMQALGKESSELEPLAKAGNEGAKKRIAEIDEVIRKTYHNQQDQIAAANKIGIASLANTRDDTIRQARLSGLRTEAAAGNAAARLQLDRLTISREQEATQRALQAIAKDDTATELERLDAAKQLAALKHAQGATEDNSLNVSELSILERMAALGDVGAAVKARQLQLAKEQIEAEATLRDIIAEASKPSTGSAQEADLRIYKTKVLTEYLAQQGHTLAEIKDAQEQLNALTNRPEDNRKAEAQRQLDQLKQLQKQQIGNEVKDAGLFILQQEAALGDKIAEAQLKKIELERTYNEEKQKLLGILKNEAATDKQKADAKKTLSGLDATEARAARQLGGPDKQPQLATLVESNFLTGVSAALSQERDQYAPIVDATKEHKEVSKGILDLLSGYLVPFIQGMANQQTQEIR